MAAILNSETALWTLVGIAVASFFTYLGVTAKTRPDNKRAENEATLIAANVAEKLRLETVAAGVRLKQEFDALNKQNRKDIHDLIDKQAVTEAALYQANKALLEAASVQREDRADMDNMLFLIRILIDEVKRLDPDPNNKIIEQAEIVMEHMGRKTKASHAVSLPDPRKSKALNTAEGAVDDAEATLASTQATCKEVKRVEGDGK